MMSDERGPPQKPAGQPVTVTTTTTTASPTYSLDWIKFDFAHFKTIPGYLKLIQLFFGILCMALGSPAIYGSGGTNFFLFVVVMSFILTLIWVIVYLLTVRETLQFRVPWVIIEFYYTAGATVFYFVAMIVEFCSVTGYLGVSSYIAAAVFALFNTLAYAYGTFILFSDWKSTAPPTTTTTTASVA